MMLLGKVIREWFDQIDWDVYAIEDSNWELESDYNQNMLEYDEDVIVIKDSVTYNTSKLTGRIYKQDIDLHDEDYIPFKSLLHKYAKSLTTDGISFECPKDKTAAILDYLKSNGCKIVGISK